MANRIIGRHTGAKHGPLIVAFGAVHGNEPLGVQALSEVFKMLEAEPAANLSFEFQGRLLGLVGNRRAFSSGQRFLEKDLNRAWTAPNVQRIGETERETLRAEDLEIAELLEAIRAEVLDYQPETLVFLDLHTTSADGGIFCIPTDSPASLRLAKQLRAPVILGLMDGIEGTLLHFATENRFAVGGFPKRTIGAAFEGGQHTDPLSVSRLISATVHCLRACGCVRDEDVDNRHDAILQAYSARLPKVARIQHVHHIRPGDDFRMKPGYANFQPIQKGELLAEDVEGAILAPDDGLILMPLYQKQGSDGFFVVQEI